MAALFAIAKTWKQMSINRLMDKVDGDTHTHTHNGILLIHKKERMSFAATWMDIEIITLREESHTKTNIMISIICGI